MQQLIEFAGNHALMSGGFVALVLMLIWTEITRRTQGYSEVTPSQAVPLINDSNTVVVDISASADFHKGHIVGAKSFLPSRFKNPDAELMKLKGRNIVVACKSGQSAQSAASALVKIGATQVAVLKGGMSQWVGDNYPVTRD